MLLSTQEYLARMSSSRRGATSYDTGYGRNVEALRGSPVATSPSMLAAAEPPVPVESPCDEELQLLRERVEKLENAVKRTQELYNKTVNDIFNSVPAKASSMERGAVQYPFRQPSRVEICFGRRFPETPKIAVWISLRDPVVQHAGSAAATAAASAAASNSGSGAGYLIENELGAELIKIKPACITVNNRLAIVKLPQEVINAAATFERKQKAVLHWIAWCTNTVNPRLAALIQKVISSPAAGLSRQLKNEIQDCIDTCGGVNGCDDIGQTLLHGAALTGNNELVTWLLHKGATIDCADRQGWTPLLMAVSERHPDTVQLLLKKGASINVTCERGVTCLHLLMRWPEYSPVQLRLALDFMRPSSSGNSNNSGGLDVNVQSDSGETPLLHLCRKRENCMDMAQALLNNGANPALGDLTGLTPLHVAAETNKANLAELLIKNGAPLDAVGPEGTPATVAMRHRSRDVIRVLARSANVTPDSVYERILRLLAPADLCRAMGASRRFRTICGRIANDESYWQSACGAPRDVYTAYYALDRKAQRALRQAAPTTAAFVPRTPVAVAVQSCPRIAVAVLGAAFAGKSNLITRFCAQTFGAYASLQMETIAAGQFKMYASRHILVNVTMDRGLYPTELVLVEVPDPLTPAAEANFAPLWGAFAGAVVVADLTRKDAADNARRLANVWFARAREDMRMNVLIAGSKTDVQHTGFVRNSAAVLRLADEVNAAYVPTSAKSNAQVDAAMKILCDRIAASQQSLMTAYNLLSTPELQRLVY